MAQWKRAGPITQRSEDQNLALLVILLLQECLKTFDFFLFTYFPAIKLKKNDATVDNRERMRATKYRSTTYGFVNVLISERKMLTF